MVKIGLVGAGFMGSTHASCYRLIEEAKLAAVADVRTELAERIAKEHGGRHFHTLDDMLNDIGDEIDAVDICLPTYLHAQAAEKALRQGKHTIVEKPLALTVEEGRRVVEAARDAERQCMVANVMRFWPEYIFLRALIRKEQLGRPTSASLWRITQRRKRGTSWQEWLYDPSRCGSPAMDLHIHDLDFARSVLGEPVTFSARGRIFEGRLEHLFAHYTFPGDVPVSIESGWDFPLNFPFEMGYRCVFENGALEFQSRASSTRLYRSDGSSEEVSVPKPRIPDSTTAGNISSILGYYSELAYFVGCINSGRPVEEASAADALRSLDVLLKVVSSI